MSPAAGPGAGSCNVCANGRENSPLAVASCRRLAADFPGSAAAIEEARRSLSQGRAIQAWKPGLLSIHRSPCTDVGELEKALTYARRAVEILTVSCQIA